MEDLREAANSIADFLEFTSEVSRRPESPLPVLDTQLWMDANTGSQEPWYSHNAEGPGTGERSDKQQVLQQASNQQDINPTEISHARRIEICNNSLGNFKKVENN